MYRKGQRSMKHVCVYKRSIKFEKEVILDA